MMMDVLIDKCNRSADNIMGKKQNKSTCVTLFFRNVQSIGLRTL